MELSFQFIADGTDGDRLDAAFARYWPSYERWLGRSRPQSFVECLRQLRHHMPELLPTFEMLHARFGGSDEIGRFLTLYNPPRVVRACTQLMLDTDSGPLLLRSYDHHPGLLDGIILRSEWSGTQTLAVADCIWGALDGINSDGLAIALAFGGRNALGDGFSAPLICRYILETCSSTAEARSALARLPVYMPYTFAVIDASGEFVTAFLGPDVDATFVTRRASTNHQRGIDWPKYANFVETEGRLERIEQLVDPTTTVEQVRQAFLSQPVWRTHYDNASGTLYVAEYSCSVKRLSLHWPGRTEHFDLTNAIERTLSVALPDSPVT